MCVQRKSGQPCGRPRGPRLRPLLALLLFPFVQSEASDEGLTLFETRIRPLLVSRCYECHSDKSGRSRGGLKVDSAEALRRGGDSGPAVKPGQPQKSLLYQVLLYSDEHSQMPPSGKLPDTIVADVHRWIELGADDPRQTKIHPGVASAIDVEQGRRFWAYQPPRSVEPPPHDDWSRTRIDRFVAARRDKQLTCVKDADARTLVRRLHLVLTGLPPAPDDMQHWQSQLQSQRQPDVSSGPPRKRPLARQASVRRRSRN